MPFLFQHIEESYAAENEKKTEEQEKSVVSSLFDMNFDARKSSRSSPKSSPTRSPPPKVATFNGDLDPSDIASTSQGHVHIDSLKKKLLADQIRQKMENKCGSPLFDFGGDFGFNSNKKRRGRPPKISNDDDDCNMTPKELEVSVDMFYEKK